MSISWTIEDEVIEFYMYVSVPIADDECSLL